VETTEKDPNKSKYDSFEQKLHDSKITFEERSNRVCQFLEIVGRLYRDIRGRREDLTPLFIIGGVYDTLNPFFENAINLEWIRKGMRPKINTTLLKGSLERKYILADKERFVKDDTFIGIADGFYSNSSSDFDSYYINNDIKKHIGSPQFAIEQMKRKVIEYYNSRIDLLRN
jgi:CRISPR-associated protein Cst2